MQDVAVVREAGRNVSVTAAVTALVEGSATAAVEPAPWRETAASTEERPLYAGTVDTLFCVDHPLTQATLTRATRPGTATAAPNADMCRQNVYAMDVTTSEHQHAALAALDARLNALLPEEYQGAYEDVQPVSMGSAALKLGRDGKVAWDMMWDTYCDLAMAGGPPHKGTLLEPAASTAIEGEPTRYHEAVSEICRGIRMVTGLEAEASPTRGWIRVTCLSEGMAGWLLRAVVMENVAARAEGTSLYLPAGPGYRLEKEIKNVITVIAKTSHYWLGHMSRAQQRAIGRLFVTMAAESPLVVPPSSCDSTDPDGDQPVWTQMGDRIHQETGLQPSDLRYTGWVGVVCPSVRAAIWIMRAMVVSNVLARREGTVLFVPVHPVQDPSGQQVVSTLTRMHRLAAARLAV